MTTKTDIITLIKGVADATGVDAMKVSLGSEGSVVLLGGLMRATGMAWVPEPKSFPIVIEGIAAWLDSHGVGGAPGFQNIQLIPVAGTILSSSDLVEITSPVLATLPLAATVGAGQQIVVKAVSAAGASVGPSGGDTIDGAAVALTLAAAYDSVRLYAASPTEWRTW